MGRMKKKKAAMKLPVPEKLENCWPTISELMDTGRYTHTHIFV
jgi:hypothetical protein